MAKKRVNGEGNIRKKPNGRWEDRYTQRIDPNTAKAYESIIENHIVPAIGGVKLKRLTAFQIQKMYNDSKTKGRVQRFEKQTNTELSVSTVRRIYMMLSSALKQAVKERIIPYNPCDNCRIPPKEKRR